MVENMKPLCNKIWRIERSSKGKKFRVVCLSKLPTYKDQSDEEEGGTRWSL